MIGLERWRPFHFIPLVILLLGALFTTLGVQMYREVSILRSAPQDNVQWTLAQIEIELLKFLNALRAAELAAEPEPQLLDEVRTRFDIFYSRIATIEGSRAFDGLTALDEFQGGLSSARDALNESVGLIDGDDAALSAALPQLETRFESLQPAVRNLSLNGVREFASLSDERRRNFSLLVFQTAGVGLVLIIALILALAVLFWQRKVAERRSEQIRESRSRYANTVDVSLDAIIVANGEGKILDFNTAAEKTFGYSKARAIGSEMAELIVPVALRQAHREGMRRYLRTGQSKLVGGDRIELEALHSDGSIFPVELSIGVAAGQGGQPLFISYVRDISGRKKIEAELTNARDRALEADKAKSQFLAVMSHEMRTPLNAVLATLDLLRHSQLDERQGKFVKTAITSGEILQHHIDDVLDLTRIEAGAIDLRPRAFDIAELVDEVQNSMQLAAAPKGNRIFTDVSIDDTVVCLDRNRLRQILLNLVGNANKFTEKGEICVTVSEQPDPDGRPRLVIEVKDTGIGIAQKDLHRIFDDFVTLDPSFKRTAEGYGLGLAICRRIAAAMGGKITVRSEEHVGSSFTVSVPQAEGFAAALQDDDVSSEREGALPAGASLHILLVEDNETNRFVARAMLEEENCTVEEAVDGQDGVEKAAEERFDLILMDISMPRLDGIEASRAIRHGSGPSRDVPIVCLTAHAMTETQDAMEGAGVTDWLIKPLRRKNLRRILSTALEGETSPGQTIDEASEGIVDHSVVEELRSLMKEEKFQRSLQKFIGDLTTMRHDFERFCRSGENEEALKLAHSLAGSSGMMGAVALSEVFRHLQDLAHDGDTESILELLDDVDDLAHETVSILEVTAGQETRPAASGSI
ncbi:hybrid sensor histidine kinase/response regulator [Notoacmeibacter ruber]|uniref:histidine kinase n=1 Tax=Notoacmeibacter ruber TaxID=2670375 RepID=A0A3L7JDM4_9HYPH|nr:PAS domain-containing hybrid sensor histidine kinase/response regulator [Notoacmeibacter ruber]RLQ88867.1 PAS domain S-box protein [Notoacmeibacter ruber]